MIIKGKSRAAPRALAIHLSNGEKNERVELIETRGTVATDLRGALIEMHALAAGTRCTKTLYHAAISPEMPHLLTAGQRTEAIEALEAKLGLTGHARTVVLHEKKDRQHIHVVWSRIDLEKMRTVSDSHNYRKHEEVARDLERRFGHDRVQGAHHERDGVPRPDRTPSRAELQQEERTGIIGKVMKAEVTAIFKASDGPEALKAALAERGYLLAQGDRRDFVIVDKYGGIHSLARRIDGMKAAELREFMEPMDRTSLPTIEQAREIAKHRTELLESHKQAATEKGYARGEGYVSQSQAALKDHGRRQSALDKSQDKDAGKNESRRERLLRTIEKDDRRRRAEEQPDRQHEAPDGGRTRSR
jgi:hypothetical protein